MSRKVTLAFEYVSWKTIILYCENNYYHKPTFYKIDELKAS